MRMTGTLNNQSLQAPQTMRRLQPIACGPFAEAASLFVPCIRPESDPFPARRQRFLRHRMSAPQIGDSKLELFVSLLQLRIWAKSGAVFDKL